MTAYSRRATAIRTAWGSPTWHMQAPLHGDHRRVNLMACGVRLRDDKGHEKKRPEEFSDEDQLMRCGSCFPDARRPQ